MFATYTGAGAGQVNVADMVTGSLRYMFNGTENLQFGDSRSSVAVDKEGCTSRTCTLWCANMMQQAMRYSNGHCRLRST